MVPCVHSPPKKKKKLKEAVKKTNKKQKLPTVQGEHVLTGQLHVNFSLRRIGALVCTKVETSNVLPVRKSFYQDREKSGE